MIIKFISLTFRSAPPHVLFFPSNQGWGVTFSRGGLPPLHGRARLTKAIKRTLLSILEQAAAAHYLAAQLISKAVRNAQQSSKWNSLIWYFPIMPPYSVVMTGGRWNICPIMETHLIPLSLSCLISALPVHLGHSLLRRNQRLAMWCVYMCVSVWARVCVLVQSWSFSEAFSNWTQLSAP